MGKTLSLRPERFKTFKHQRVYLEEARIISQINDDRMLLARCGAYKRVLYLADERVVHEISMECVMVLTKYIVSKFCEKKKQTQTVFI